jgi:hypothetical protein
MTTQRKLLALTAMAVTFSMSGCWDDSNNDPVPATPVTQVPDSAGVSTASFVSFLLGLNATDELSEPLTIGDAFAVPAEEAADATPLT